MRTCGCVLVDARPRGPRPSAAAAALRRWSRAQRDRRQHAGDVLGLPQHLVERHLGALARGASRRRSGAPRRATPATAARPWPTVVMIWPALAWLVMRLAVCTLAPNTSRVSSTTGPKWQPMRIATGWPSTLSSAWRGICCCIWPAALSASSAVGNVAMTSSPMVLMTVPLCCSVARAHDVDADRRSSPRARWSPRSVEEAGAADDVGEQDGEFDVLDHFSTSAAVAGRAQASHFSHKAGRPARLEYTRHIAARLRQHPGKCLIASRKTPAAARRPRRVARTLGQPLAIRARAGLAGVQPQHVARDRGERHAGASSRSA